MKFKRIDKLTKGGFFLSIFLFLLFLIFSEISLVLLDKKEVFADFEYYASRSFSEKEWEEAKKFRIDLTKMGERGSAIPGSVAYRYKPANLETIRINSLGFRGKEVKKKQKGEFRVGFFGDSRIWGIYLPDDKTIPALIEEGLKRHFKNDKISVLNLGIEGYDIKRSVSFAKAISPELELDLALFYIGDADMIFAYNSGNGDWINFDSEEDFKNRIKMRDIYPTTWFSRRRVVSIISQTYNSDLKKEAEKRNKNFSVLLPPQQFKTAEEFPMALLNRMEDVAQYFAEQNVDTIFILSPSIQNKVPLSDVEKRIVSDFDKRYGGYSFYIAKCTDGMRNLLKAKRRPFGIIDQTQIFDGKESTMFYDELHFTPEATRITARSILFYLQNYLRNRFPPDSLKTKNAPSP